MILRLVQLLVGLILFGVGCAVMVRAGIGIDPWSVLAQGLALRTGVGMGWITVIVGALVLLLWWPLRQKPGVGTIANVLVVGTSMELTLNVMAPVAHYGIGIVVFVGGMLLVGLASGIYIGARLGPGPRDGLMTGLNQRFGIPIWRARMSVEVVVLAAGWVLGGTVGLGTVLFAFGIGPIVHVCLPWFDTARRAQRQPDATPEPTPATSE